MGRRPLDKITSYPGLLVTCKPLIVEHNRMPSFECYILIWLFSRVRPRMSNPIMSNKMWECPKMSNALINERH